MSSGFTELDTRLERGEIVSLEKCPFELPFGDDLAFLLQLQLKGSSKNISYNPATQAVTGFVEQSAAQADRLRDLMSVFSERAITWLGSVLPRYAQSWQPDRATFRPEEEATRRVRLTARNDLLHFDAFPSRPTRGQRILRLYANVNPTDERVWATADLFARVLEEYGERVGLPGQNSRTWVGRLGQGILGLVQPSLFERTEYDEFMLRLHHFLKSNQKFQECASRRLWHFPPGSAWILFADAISHAELRGQYALEHSFFVAPHTLALPDEAPFALLERWRGTQSLTKVA